jgi:plasmid stabilization system protein ParE
MPNQKLYSVNWTDSSLKQSILIKKYIEKNFSEKEINGCYQLLESFEKAISIYPELYPKSTKKSSLRRAVLSREMTAFYSINKKHIDVIALFDNRCDLSNWD